MLEVTISVVASPSINRGSFLQLQQKPFAYFTTIAGRASTQRHQKELPVPSSCSCVSRACGSPVFDFRYTLGQLGCILLRVTSVSVFLRPSQKILGFSWCSLSLLSWRDGPCSCSLHLWDVLFFSLHFHLLIILYLVLHSLLIFPLETTGMFLSPQWTLTDTDA